MSGSAANGDCPLSPELVWSEIDHEILRHKLSLISSEMQAKVASEERNALFECRKRGNSGSIKPTLLELHVKLTDEWLERVYQAYCDVWNIQGNTKSAAFIRAVFEKALVPLLLTRQGAIVGEFEMIAIRTRDHSYGPVCDELARSLQRLRSKWWDKLEIEAGACKYAPKANSSASKIRYTAADQPSLNSGANENDMAENRVYVAVANPGYKSVWNLIDSTLVRLELQEPLEQHVKAVVKERESIEVEHRGRRQAYVTAILKMVEHRADEWIATKYRVYCEVWRLQGHTVNAEFLRTLQANIIEPVTHARTNAEVDSFKRMWNRCGFPGRQVLESQLAAFERSMRNLEHRWKTKLEIEARELEHQLCVTTDKGNSDNVAQKPSPVSPESHEHNQAAWAPRAKYVSKLGYRSTLKRAIALIFINNPKASDLEVCRGLDADGAVELPKTWSIERNRRFDIAYKNSVVRRRIEIAISKVRTDLRGRGL